ncbi:MAG: Arm DNA-binding domain-containing protein, partial [Formosimonas sp.]
MKTRLTNALIKAAKPTAKFSQLSDGGGLVLHIMPNGSKLWRYRYRFNGKASMLSLGDYPTTSLKDARAARDNA